jgi:hypothetical protein
LDLSLRVLLLALVALSFAYRVWASVLRKAPWSLCEALWNLEHGWQLGFRDGHWREATLLPSTLVTTRLVILNFRVHWLRYHSLLLTEAVIEPDLLRRLRVHLRLQRARA